MLVIDSHEIGNFMRWIALSTLLLLLPFPLLIWYDLGWMIGQTKHALLFCLLLSKESCSTWKPNRFSMYQQLFLMNLSFADAFSMHLLVHLLMQMHLLINQSSLQSITNTTTTTSILTQKDLSSRIFHLSNFKPLIG